MTFFWVTLTARNIPCFAVTLDSINSEKWRVLAHSRWVKDMSSRVTWFLLTLHSTKTFEENPHFKEHRHNAPSHHISKLVPMLYTRKHTQMPKKCRETGTIDTSLVCPPWPCAPVTFRFMSLLKLSYQSQIIPPQPINEQVFSRWYSTKLVAHRNRVVSAWS